MSSRYYLFPVFVFWTRLRVNTFMLLLLPKSLFLLHFVLLYCTCSAVFGWFQACFTYLMILGKQTWFSVTPNAAVLHQEEFCLRNCCWICAMCETKLHLWKRVLQPVCIFTVCSKCSGSSGKAVKVIRSCALPFQKTPPRACAGPCQGVCPGWGCRVSGYIPCHVFSGQKEYDTGENHSILG